MAESKQERHLKWKQQEDRRCNAGLGCRHSRDYHCVCLHPTVLALSESLLASYQIETK